MSTYTFTTQLDDGTTRTDQVEADSANEAGRKLVEKLIAEGFVSFGTVELMAVNGR